jgi:alanine dehydrogenase
MLEKLHIGILRESKSPPDTRVVLSPDQCLQVEGFNDSFRISVQSSPDRCFSDVEYIDKGISIVENLESCDIILGVKEVKKENLIPNKTYFFFSHTIKRQPYNQFLFKRLSELEITLIDYELLQRDGIRVIAFGKFAGIVGAYNALYTFGKRSGKYSLQRMYTFKGLQDVIDEATQIDFPNFKIVLSGSGRVAKGAAEMLENLNIRKVTPNEFMTREFQGPVFTQLGPFDYVKHKNRKSFELKDFYSSPEDFESIFLPFSQRADIFINGIYWDPKAPRFFTMDQMNDADFSLQVISDVTCDIAPESSVPSTIRATTIVDPIYGFDPSEGKEIPPFTSSGIDMTTIDNLPNELPRDASISFGGQFIENVLPELANANEDGMISRATILKNGKLTRNFEYLRDYLEK